MFRNLEGKDMKSFFIRLLAAWLFAAPYTVSAGVRSASAPLDILPVNPEKRLNEMKKLYEEMPDLNNKNDVRAYLSKRLRLTTPADIDPNEAAIPSATSIVNPDEIKQKEEATLSAYEKIYRESMRNAGSVGDTINENVELQGTFYRLKETENDEARPFVPDFPYVTVKLSDSREILAPADEHFPYVLTTIKIEPTGLLRVTEEFIFISNNESFPNGFFRILPKYNYSRNGDRRRTDITLESVTVNGEEKPYHMTEIGNYLHIEPDEPLNLPTGIYTYRFKYLIDRAVWFYDNFDELYWDITAKTLKNVVGSANAVVFLPSNKSFVAQNAVASTRGGLDNRRVTINTLASNSLGFADTEALGVGEDIHLFLTMEKGTLLPPDFSKKYQWFIHDYGASLFALFALLAILLSYRISFEQIRRNKDKTNAYLKKTPAIFRLLNANVFDRRSFGAEILNLCAKNVLELRARENGAVLIKKTDNLKKLSPAEQKLVACLFPGQETSLPATPESRLKLERAYRALRYAAYRQFHLFKLKLNALYLIFSLAMLVCGIVGSALLAVSPWNTFWIIIAFTALLFPYIMLFMLRFKSNAVTLAVKAFAALCVLWTAGWLAIYTSNFYAVLMILSVYLIISYYRLFSRRSGLLRNKIKETEDYKSYLQKNPELAQSGRDFAAKIPYIFAFGLENSYKGEESFAQIKPFLSLLPENTAETPQHTSPGSRQASARSQQATSRSRMQSSADILKQSAAPDSGVAPAQAPVPGTPRTPISSAASSDTSTPALGAVRPETAAPASGSETTPMPTHQEKE